MEHVVGGRIGVYNEGHGGGITKALKEEEEEEEEEKGEEERRMGCHVEFRSR
jgi:hypothetical protein